uniref:C-type lectin domain-containing protein n=1 Tax=Cyprinus carpio TaxID=7962 RepID=A0A8C2BKB4_CYPCA
VWVFVSHVCLLCVTSPRRHFEGMFALSSELKVYRTKNWTESRRYCTERGADLVIINNKEEQDFVKKISRGTQTWIGLSDIFEESKWKWVDGSALNFRFWLVDEPRGQTVENCVVTHVGWVDYPCTSVFKWICEKINVK